MNPYIRPKQSLGQNFLTDPGIALKIVDKFGLLSDDTVLEIGPGQGALTEILLQKVCRLYCVEIDRRCIMLLEEKFPNITIFHADFIKFHIDRIETERKLRIVGNIPYHITSPILFHVLDARDRVQDLTLLIQREVAERTIAPPGCKAYGILSVLSQAVADVKILMQVPRTVFKPRPKIDSSLIRWRFKENHQIKDFEFFRKIVRQGFSQRRKMLRNTLSEYVNKINFDFTQRPEQLSVAQWTTLTNSLVD